MTTKKAAPGRSICDWEAMEPDWRAGIISVLQLSRRHGVSRAAIIKHWGKAGTKRDLAARIRAEAQSRLDRATVTVPTVTPSVTPTTRVTDGEVVAANAEVLFQILGGQRETIARHRELVKSMLRELEETTDQPEEFAKLGEMMASPDFNSVDKLNEIYRKVISLPQRVDILKKLAEILKILIGLEREAFGIKGEATPGETIDAFLSKLDDA